MYVKEDIRELQLEPTTRCQARCPMCPRRPHGGLIHPDLIKTDVTLEQFKDWFDEDFLSQLDSFILCGNHGEPILNKQLLDIISYFKSVSDAEVKVFTNGSARSQKFWKALAELDVYVVFAIDGLSGVHEKYRINTKYETVISNAKLFIRNGGRAQWDMLAFEHNSDQINECRNKAQQLGFKHFDLKHTPRFLDDKYEVHDTKGNVVDFIHPTETSKFITEIHMKQRKFPKPDYIDCFSKWTNQLYVSANGFISPCCVLDPALWKTPNDPVLKEMVEDFNEKVYSYPNLNENSLDVLFDWDYFNDIEESHYSDDPLKFCSSMCGKCYE